MKKLFFILSLIVPAIATAQTMCVRDKSLVISLDKNVGGTGSGSNASEMIWWTDFSYGRIYGEATCLSAAEGLGRTAGTGAYYGVEEYATTPITAEVGLNGTDANGNERKYCWCRATHPVSSRWVFSSATLRRPIASRIARSTAVAASRIAPLCAGACLGRSASDVPSNIEYV